MSPQVVLRRPSRLTVRERTTALAAVMAAQVVLTVARGSPAHIRNALRALPGAGKPAHPMLASSAHAAVVTVSLSCASPNGCLLRSVAVVLLCRARGGRVRWVVGCSSPPPASHAWVETTEGPVDEPKTRA